MRIESYHGHRWKPIEKLDVKPCVFCNGKNLQMGRDSRHEAEHFVFCLDCGAQGPRRGEWTWNYRFTSA